MTQPCSAEGYALHTSNHVIESTFDSLEELRSTLDHIALAESLFGTSELSPLSTPGVTPPPSPVLEATMDIDGGGSCLDNAAPLNLNTSIRASPSSQPTYTHRTHPLDPEIASQAPSSTPLMYASGAERRKAKKKGQSHANRQKKRQTAREATYANIKVRPECVANFIDSSTPIYTDSEAKKASRINTGYTGRDDGGRSSKLYTLDELVGEGSKFGFKLQEWDGK